MRIPPKVGRHLEVALVEMKAALVEMKQGSTEVLGRDPEADMSVKDVRDDINVLVVTEELIRARLILLQAKLKRLEFAGFAASRTGGHSIQ